MAYLGYDAADLSIGFGCNSLDAWAFSGLNASVEIVPPPYDISQQVPQESSLPSYAEVNSWFPESLLNLSSSEINNDILHDAASQNELYCIDTDFLEFLDIFFLPRSDLDLTYFYS
jgi:hypothetical protein